MFIELTTNSSYDIEGGILSIFPNKTDCIHFTIDSVASIHEFRSECEIVTFAENYKLFNMEGPVMGYIIKALLDSLKEYDKD